MADKTKSIWKMPGLILAFGFILGGCEMASSSGQERVEAEISGAAAGLVAANVKGIRKDAFTSAFEGRFPGLKTEPFLESGTGSERSGTMRFTYQDKSWEMAFGVLGVPATKTGSRYDYWLVSVEGCQERVTGN